MRHEELELLKWLALATMVVDHLGKTVLPSLAEPTHFAGRLALPLFAWIMAQRLRHDPTLHGRYLRRLAAFGLVAQPAYALVAGWSTANILFTLGLGVMADLAVTSSRRGRRWPLLLVPLVLALGTRCEFGSLGVALVPALAGLERWRPGWSAGAAGPLALAANVRGTVAWLDAGALVATPFLWLLRGSPARVPRLHRWFFYGFYPAHLYLLAGAEIALRSG